MGNKIAFIVSSLNYGGAERQTVNDANLLSENNEVFLITFYEGPQKSLINKSVKYIKIEKKGYFKTAFELKKILLQNDIKIIHSSLFASMIISAIASLFVNVKVIWHFHSHEYDLPVFAKIAFIICSRFRNIKVISFVSKELSTELTKRFYFPESKNCIIYNSGNVELLKIKKSSEKIIIGYVGRIVGIKRVHYLPEVADYLQSKFIKGFEIRIVGDGDKLESIKEDVNERNLSDYFRFFGFREDIQYFYEKFDMFILPSEEECLSVSLIDAGLSGIPSLAFDVGGNSEIVINGETGYIVNSLELLKEKSLELIKNGNLRNKLGEKAGIHCRNNFSKEIRKQKIEELNNIVL